LSTSITGVGIAAGIGCLTPVLVAVLTHVRDTARRKESVALVLAALSAILAALTGEQSIGESGVVEYVVALATSWVVARSSFGTLKAFAFVGGPSAPGLIDLKTSTFSPLSARQAKG
jgi:hypothetical protein